jgi:hypothetical protein
MNGMLDLQPVGVIRKADDAFVLPPGATSLELLQAVYRSPAAPLNTRIRCAMAALPFEHPKLAVMAMVPDAGNWADRLEKALAASGRILELRKIEEPQPTRMRR